MNIKEKTLQLKKDFDDVYNKGRQDGNGEGYVIGKEQGYSEGYSQSESDFWENIQQSGDRTDYNKAFQKWKKAEYITPKYLIAPTTNTTYLFSECTNLKSIDDSKFDFSGLAESYINYNGPCYAMFNKCSNIEYIPDLKIPSTISYGYFCYLCRSLVTLEILRASKSSIFDGTFSGCTSLKNVTIEGEIGNNFNIFYSPLSTASIVSIIEHLSDTSGATLTLNTNAKDNMVFPYTSPYTNITYNSWDELIATKTNWTISTTTP